MAEVRKVAVLVGSLRKDSFSGKVAKALAHVAPASLQLEEVPIGELALYNQDIDAENRVPAAWISFREQVKKYDAVLFVTPEYNRSVPAVLKNALDVGSRPYGQSVWDGKPGGVVSVSPGRISAFGANHHLRQSLVFLNVPTMQQPEAYFGEIEQMLDADGKISEENSKYFKQFIDAYAAWVELILAGKA